MHFHIVSVSRTDLQLLFFFIGFSGCFYLGCWLCYTGLRRIVRHRLTGANGWLIAIGLGLFVLSTLSFQGWYHHVTAR
jgi:hypothetical protein